ncbi:MAG TPA: hypothetical protein ACFYD7_09675, partial [Candidatus Wujingus californicus]
EQILTGRAKTISKTAKAVVKQKAKPKINVANIIQVIRAANKKAFTKVKKKAKAKVSPPKPKAKKKK